MRSSREIATLSFSCRSCTHRDVFKEGSGGAAYSPLHGNTVDGVFGSDARLRLYQRRFLRPRRHFSAFFKLQSFAFAQFQISVIFQSLCTARRKNRPPFCREAESINRSLGERYPPGCVARWKPSSGRWPRQRTPHSCATRP